MQSWSPHQHRARGSWGVQVLWGELRWRPCLLHCLETRWFCRPHPGGAGAGRRWFWGGTSQTTWVTTLQSCHPAALGFWEDGGRGFEAGRYVAGLQRPAEEACEHRRQLISTALHSLLMSLCRTESRQCALEDGPEVHVLVLHSSFQTCCQFYSPSRPFWSQGVDLLCPLTDLFLSFFMYSTLSWLCTNTSRNFPRLLFGPVLCFC